MNRPQKVKRLAEVLTELRNLIVESKRKDEEVQILMDSRGFMDLVYLDCENEYKSGMACVRSEELAEQIVAP